MKETNEALVEEERDRIRKLWEAELERRERLSRYQRSLLIFMFVFWVLLFSVVLVGKEILTVCLIGFAITLIGTAISIYGIVTNS